MLRKSVNWMAILSIALLCACGTNKKLKAALETNQQLNSRITDLNSQVSDLKKQVGDLTNANTSMKTEFDQYKASCQESERKLQAFRAAMHDQAANLQRVEKRLEEALANFRNNGVDVFYKDGLVYVEMADNLLYRTGSARLADSGRRALGSLAAALNEYPKLKVIVMGNTDDVQFKKGSDNWSLSTERANGVVRTLRDDFQVDPVRLTAAGRSKYNPVADNTTAEGRAKNRRTDIILNPDLERIWQEVQQEQ